MRGILLFSISGGKSKVPKVLNDLLVTKRGAIHTSSYSVRSRSDGAFGETKCRPDKVTGTFHSDAPQPQPSHYVFLNYSLKSYLHSLSHYFFSGYLSLVRSVPLNFLISCILGTFCVVFNSHRLHRSLRALSFLIYVLGWVTQLAKLHWFGGSGKPSVESAYLEWDSYFPLSSKAGSLPLASCRKIGVFFTQSSQWVKFLFHTCSKCLISEGLWFDDM